MLILLPKEQSQSGDILSRAVVVLLVALVFQPRKAMASVPAMVAALVDSTVLWNHLVISTHRFHYDNNLLFLKLKLYFSVDRNNRRYTRFTFTISNQSDIWIWWRSKWNW